MFEPVINASEKARPHPAPIVGIGYLSILLVSLFVSCVANHVQENKVDDTGKTTNVLKNIGPGDFVETRDGKIYAVPHVPRSSNDYILVLALPYSAPKNESAHAIAKKTVRVIRTNDPAWPETAGKYLLDNP